MAARMKTFVFCALILPVVICGCGGAASTASASEDTPHDGAEKIIGYVFHPHARTLNPTPTLLQLLRAPDGFTVDVFVRDLKKARMMAVADDGAVYLTRPDEGDVLRIVYGQEPTTVVSGLDGVHGIALHDGRLYLATTKEVIAADLKADGSVGERRVIINDLPDAGQHGHRTVGFGPDGMLYISIGSDCNACSEPDATHAVILRAHADGSGREVFAKGLRNTMGFAWHPQTHQLWGMDQGSDWMGNDEPPEELNRIEEHGDYGWPLVWGDRQINRVFSRPDLNTKQYSQTTVPSVLAYQAHSAPIAMIFYTGTQFPPDYRNDAFVAFHGSWNRSPASGYKVARIHFENGQPQRFEDFLTGFLVDNGKVQVGRVAGLAVMKDGSLLVSDDSNGVIYRVRYRAGNQS
jgi:glucose/arabinose dehydrogenase